LFQAAKQSVAAKYLPIHHHRQSWNTSHVEACASAAIEIAKLAQHLLLTNQSAVMFDYHFPFNAAIVLELVSLLHEGQDHMESINVLMNYLQKAGELGNESAADCVRIVTDFGDVVARLKSQSVKSPGSRLMELPAGPGVGLLNYTATQGTQDGQSATFEELLSWFTEGLV
jgi:hypothetical protein